MNRSRHNFEHALENLEKLKKISYGFSDSFLNGPKYSERLEDCDLKVSEMKEALRNVEDYLYEISASSKGETDRALKESEFLISGVQNIFSFLENQENNLYHSLADEYKDVSDAFSQAQTHLKQTPESSPEEIQESITAENQDLFLNNLVEVKKDHSYELFYMTDEENKRFYSDALAQIIYKQSKLHEAVHENDPLTKTLLWNSCEVKKTSSLLVATNDVPLRLFYQDALKHLDIESVEKAHNAVMALLFSRYETTAVYNSPKKSNLLYFNDFLYFLRCAWKALHNDMGILSQEQKQAKLLTATLSAGIFESRLIFEDVAHYLYFQIKLALHPEGEKKPLSSGQYVVDVYEELHRMFSKYPNGPLFKAIDRILDSGMNVFDPMLLGMFPSLEGSLKLGEQTIDIIRSPSPVSQSSILYATCNEEFLGFLSAKGERGDVSLILNIQNRVSRKERARCRVLEEALEQAEYASHAHIFSFPNPEELLDNLEKVHGDIETFAEFFALLKNEFNKPVMTSSFFLSPSLKEVIPEFLDLCSPSLKDAFFSKKKILFKNDKLLLLHLISYLLVFKSIENINPNSVVVISKDGLDYASVFIAGFAFFSRDSFWDEHSLKLLITKILSPTLVARDRLVFASYIEIFSKFLNCLRKNRQTISVLRSFFNHDIENWELVGYLNEFIEASHKRNS